MSIATVYDKLSSVRTFKRHDGEYGLEIETETLTEYKTPKMSFWETHVDGSLRNYGLEYVLKSPLKFGNDLDAAFIEFQNKTKDIEFIKDSITTSVHVHMNVLNENFVTLGNILTAYALIEGLLIEFSGPTRKSNLFCLGMADAEETVKGIKNMLGNFAQKRFNVVQEYDRDHFKYAALNLSSLGHFGSLEFRSFRGTADVDEISRWVSILNSILVFARQNITPHEIVNMYRAKGMELLDDILGKYRRDVRCANEEHLVNKNFWYAAQIAHSVKDWEVFRKEAPKKKPSVKDLDGISMRLYGQLFDAVGADNQRFVLNNIEELMDEMTNGTSKKKYRVARGDAQAGLVDELVELARNAPPAWAGMRTGNAAPVALDIPNVFEEQPEDDFDDFPREDPDQ